MADLQHDLEVDKAAAFSILMAHGEGISSKSPDYMMEKWRSVQQCRDQMEVVSLLDVFGQSVFFKWRDLWFKENHADSWPHETVTIPPDGACSSTTNEDAKQEATLTLRFKACRKHSGANRVTARSTHCYIQDDGSHRKGDICVCGTVPKEECPLDLHRRQAVRGFTGESTLHA